MLLHWFDSVATGQDGGDPVSSLWIDYRTCLIGTSLVLGAVAILWWLLPRGIFVGPDSRKGLKLHCPELGSQQEHSTAAETSLLGLAAAATAGPFKSFASFATILNSDESQVCAHCLYGVNVPAMPPRLPLDQSTPTPTYCTKEFYKASGAHPRCRLCHRPQPQVTATTLPPVYEDL